MRSAGSPTFINHRPLYNGGGIQSRGPNLSQGGQQYGSSLSRQRFVSGELDEEADYPETFEPDAVKGARALFDDDVVGQGSRRADGSANDTKGTAGTTSAAKREPVIGQLALYYDPPVEGCQLRPYVTVVDVDGVAHAHRDYSHDGSESTWHGSSGMRADSPTSVPDVEMRWTKGQKRVCSAPKCNGFATMQCISCLKLKLAVQHSFFCSADCLQKQWFRHKALHKSQPVVPSRGGSAVAAAAAPAEWNQQDGDSYIVDRADLPSAVSCKFPAPCNDVWTDLTVGPSFTPSADDVGRSLRLQCAPIIRGPNGEKTSHGAWRTIETSPVLPTPAPPPARNIVYSDISGQALAQMPFTVMCYNVLAQIYATRHVYPYCPVWALSWEFRKAQLVRELLLNNTDIISLQEVQANHFETFFQPALDKAGYDGVYKKKTRENVDNPESVDGCAIFFKRNRFALVEQYGIEFNEAARLHFNDRHSLRRLLKGNVALVVVLEELNIDPKRRLRKPQPRRLCVANTHIYWDPEYDDVKLWQTSILCQELEKMISGRQLPLVLCGDFNSMEDSSVFDLLSSSQVSANHRVFNFDPCRILPPPERLRHNLSLASAYHTARADMKYTNYTGHFVGVLDYIFFTSKSVACVSVQEIHSEAIVSKHTALPSPTHPSDHTSLIVQLDWLQD